MNGPNSCPFCLVRKAPFKAPFSSSTLICTVQPSQHNSGLLSQHAGQGHGAPNSYPHPPSLPLCCLPFFLLSTGLVLTHFEWRGGRRGGTAQKKRRRRTEALKSLMAFPPSPSSPSLYTFEKAYMGGKSQKATLFYSKHTYS